MCYYFLLMQMKDWEVQLFLSVEKYSLTMLKLHFS